MTFDQYTAAVKETGDIYVACPACSGDRALNPNQAAADGDKVWNCSVCGAIFGRVDAWDLYAALTEDGELSTGDAARYIDFTTYAGERFHGWLDANGIVCQVG